MREAIEVFKIWSGEAEFDPSSPFPLWWRSTLDDHSASFPGLTYHAVEYESYSSENDTCYITVRISRKNYNWDIETFLVWLAPYSETEGFVGYMHHEVQENPLLIFFRDGKAFFRECASFVESEVKLNKSTL